MRAMRFGWISVTIAIAIIGILRFINNEPIADLLVIIATHITGTSFYQFLHDKKTDQLFSVIMGVIALGLLLATLLSEYGVY